jgi:glucan 1,3-beta-glucosidase
VHLVARMVGSSPIINGHLVYLYSGFDNSGRRINAPTWHTKASYISRTGAIIKTLANMFKDESSVVIAPLNEPAGFDGEDVLEAVEQYWKDSYGSIR